MGLWFIHRIKGDIQSIAQLEGFMMHYKIRIRWDRRKRVPKGVACTYILLGFFSLYCMLQLFSSPGSSLDNLCELRIHIDNINIMDSHDIKGSRMKLTIMDGDNLLYVWYPQSSYRNYARKIETELLTGETTSVTVKVASNQTIRDKLLHQRRIVDLRNGDSIYYDLDTERSALFKNYITCWILFLSSCALWIFSKKYITKVYKIAIFQKR